MSFSSSPPACVAAFLAVPLAVAALHPAAARSQEAERAATSFAITPVTVIDVQEGVARPDRTVVVEGNRITAVGPAESVEVPVGARVVDGTGKYLIPGLWDMHVHFGVPFAREPAQELMMSLAHGVTGVRDLGATPAVFQKLKEWRRRFRAGEVPGPRLHMAGLIIDGTPPARSHYLTATNAEEGRRVVEHLQEMDADFVKVYDGVPAEAFHAIVEEAEERGLAVAGHVPDAVGPIAASEAGLATIEHADELGFHVSHAERPADPEADSGAHPLARMRAFERYDEQRAAAVIQAFAENGTAVVPTLHTVHVLVRYDSGDFEEGALARLVSENQKREHLDELPHDLTKREQAVFERAYRNLQKMLSRMHAEGVTLLAGSHAPIPLIPHGYGLHQELARLSEAGLGTAEALRTATVHPARLMGRLAELGTIEEGKLADLVLLDANPLEDIGHIQEIAAVVLDGRYLDRAALDELLADAERAANPPDAAGDSVSSEDRSPAGELQSDTVHVAPPTGETETDRANVQAAFDAVKPGGTIQFAPGTYLLGAGARLTVPDVTVLGHSDGTVLRGCDPEAFEVERAEIGRVVFGCTGLYVQAQRQTIRGLTFEYTWHGIVVGPYPTTAEEAAAFWGSGEGPPDSYPAGGQRIEGNTFRATPNGLRVLGTGEERSIVRDNKFVDVFHAIGIYGAPLHFLDNRVTVEDPGRVPNSRHPGSAILVSPGYTDCAGHVIAGNRVEGYPGAIYVLANRGQVCRGVEIRDNTIAVRRVKVPEAWVGATPSEDDSTMVGVPITLTSLDRPVPWQPDVETEGIVEEIVIEGNRLLGAEGLGILVDGSRNRIMRNTVTGIRRRDPFPGVTWIGDEHVTWATANGAGIWVSPGSDGNEIVGNTFEDIAAVAVVVEGDSNRVVLASPEDEVRDLGTENRISIAESSLQRSPLVCIDEGHQERHTAGGTYALFAEWLRAEGFRVDAFTAPFEQGTLKRCRVLVVANALHARNQGNWALPTPSAFTPEEIEEVRSWVRDGGGLLLIADHMPFPGAARDLGDAFGLRFSNGFAVDTAVEGRTYGPYRGSSRFVFRHRDGSLASHPITEGLDGGASLDSVVTYTGQVFRAHGRFQPLLIAPAGTISLLPEEAWRFDEETPVIDTGRWLQGAAAEFGTGRVVALGEAAQFRPDDRGEARGGNAAFATNVVRWLAGLDAP